MRLLPANQRRYFDVLAACVYGLNKLCGNAPFAYDPRTQRFHTSRLQLLYPWLLTCAYIGAHIHCYRLTLTTSSPMHRVLLIARYALVAVTLAANCVHRQRLVRLLNASRRILRSLAGDMRRVRYGGAVARVAAQVTAATALTLYGSFGMFDVRSLGKTRRQAAVAGDGSGAGYASEEEAASSYEPTLAFRVVAMVLRLFSYLMQSVTVQTVYVAMWMVRFYFARIVAGIEATMREVAAAAAAASTRGSQQRRLAAAGERLDALAAVHSQLVQMCRSYNEIVAVPLLLAIGFMFLVLVTQLIVIYEILSDGERVTLSEYTYMATYAGGVLWELYRMCAGCAETVQVVRIVRRVGVRGQPVNNIMHTCVQCQSAGLALHSQHFDDGALDERFRRSLETFSLHVRQDELQITACGWFVVDRQLIFTVNAIQAMVHFEFVPMINFLIFLQIVASSIAYLVLVIQTSIFDPNYNAYH